MIGHLPVRSQSPQRDECRTKFSGTDDKEEEGDDDDGDGDGDNDGQGGSASDGKRRDPMSDDREKRRQTFSVNAYIYCKSISGTLEFYERCWEDHRPKQAPDWLAASRADPIRSNPIRRNGLLLAPVSDGIRMIRR